MHFERVKFKADYLSASCINKRKSVFTIFLENLIKYNYYFYLIVLKYLKKDSEI